MSDQAPRGAEAVPVMVLVDLDRFPAVTDALLRAGLVVDERWPEVGTLTGRVPADRLDALRALDGVLEVEPERRLFASAPDQDPAPEQDP